jgi:RNA polymerase sigma-70 factor, ECF subfamily
MVLAARGPGQGEDRTDIQAYLSGDREAFDRLVLRHQDRVFNLCHRLLGDYGEAEECAQETFVKVFRSLARFRLESGFTTWLYTIAVNTCKNRRSSTEYRFWNRVLRFVRNPREEDDPPDIEIEDPAPSPLAQMAEKEREIMVQSAMDSLEHDHRTVLVLRHVEELSYEEICKITGYNLGTLKSKLARARRRLQKKIEEISRGNPDGMLSD